MGKATYDRAPGWSLDTTITATSSAPTLATQGFDTLGAERLTYLFHTPVAAPNLSGRWFGMARQNYADGVDSGEAIKWAPIASGSIGPITAATTETDLKIMGYDRIALVVDSFSGTSIKYRTRVG